MPETQNIQMPVKTDYIPASEEGFDLWQQNFISVVKNNIYNWQIPEEEFLPLMLLQDNWEKYLAIAGKEQKATRTLVQVKEKKEAKNTFISSIRNFVRRWITKNQIITDTQRESMNIPVHEKTHQRSPVPESRPICMRINHREYLQLVLDIRDEHSLNVGKLPARVKEMELWGKLHKPFQIKRDHQMNDVSMFGFMGSFTRHLAKLKFDEGSSGGTFLFRMRWLNSRKETGPWSEVYSTIIP